MASGDVEVAVIGGGAAGIGAARRLRDAGVKALILEARDRLGGRAWTVEAGGFAIDLGCGWLHSAEAQSLDGDRRGAGPDDRPNPAAVGARDVATGPDGRQRRTQCAPRCGRCTNAPTRCRSDEPDRSLADLLEPGGRWNAAARRRSAAITAARNWRASRRATSAATPTTASTGASSKATARRSPLTAPGSTSPSTAPSRASTMAGGAFASRRRAESSKPTRRSSPCRAR